MWADNERRGVAGDLTSRPYGSPKDDDQNRFSNQTVAFPMVFRRVPAWAAWASGSMVSRRVSAWSWSPSSTASFKGFSGNERLQQCRDKAWAWIGMWGLHVGGLGQAWDSWRSPDPNPQNRDMLSFPLSPAAPWPAAWLRRRVFILHAVGLEQMPASLLPSRWRELLSTGLRRRLLHARAFCLLFCSSFFWWCGGV